MTALDDLKLAVKAATDELDKEAAIIGTFKKALDDARNSADPSAALSQLSADLGAHVASSQAADTAAGDPNAPAQPAPTSGQPGGGQPPGA